MPGVAVLWRWQARHPRQVDALLAVIVFGVAVWGPLVDGDRGPGRGPHHQLDAWALVLLAVAAAALVFRRSHPLAVWAVALAVAGVLVLHTGEPITAVTLSLVTLYTVGVHAALRLTVLTTVCTAAVYGVTVTVVDGVFGDRTATLMAFFAVAAAVGVAVRAQRAAVEAAEARARQAEATRDEEAERRVTDERLRIARELHDVVAHHISVVNVQAGVARHLLDSRPDQAREALTLVREASRTVLAEMSTVLGLLRTGEDDLPTQPAPGLDQLPALVDTMRLAGLQTTQRTQGAPAPLPQVVDLAAYRIVQESLTNALKHGSGWADLLLEHRPELIVIEVRNPVPADGSPGPGTGHGIVGMRERVASVGGRFTAGPTADGAFLVHAEIPWEGR